MPHKVGWAEPDGMAIGWKKNVRNANTTAPVTRNTSTFSRIDPCG